MSIKNILILVLVWMDFNQEPVWTCVNRLLNGRSRKGDRHKIFERIDDGCEEEEK